MSNPYFAQGQYTKQAHVGVPEGTFEEEFGRDGFFGPVSQVYHSACPTGWTRIEGPLKPQAYNCTQLAQNPLDGILPDRVLMLHNQDVQVSIVRPQETHSFCQRNADGDELYFIHQGAGSLHTDFGELPFSKGDYLVIPRGVTYRFILNASDPAFFLVFETATRLVQPDRGLLGQHALYDQTAIGIPCLTPLTPPPDQDGEWEVRIKRQNALTSVFYPFYPLNAVGWKGNFYPWRLNVHDICPVNSHRAHLPPPVHTTLQARNLVVCTFLPRPLETDPAAVKVPFYHRNIDYDEVLFYHDGDFFSRDGIKPGFITLHPQGIHHGPHPKAVEASKTKDWTNEVAVMLDTVNPLTVTPAAQATEWADYWKSWQAN